MATAAAGSSAEPAAAAPAVAATSSVKADSQTVNPWTATAGKGGFDYAKLIKQFGSYPIDGALIKRIETLTNMRAHRFLRRGLFFSQRDIEMVLRSYERGEEIYLYTGRGPTSESMHLGHMIPFEFAKYLQDAFDAIIVVQMADDEKFYFKDEGKPIEHYIRLGRENAKDIIARGFRPDKTYIFSNAEEVGGAMQRNVIRMMKAVTGNQVKGIFGLSTESNNIGQIAWPIYQSVPAYCTSFPEVFNGKANIPCLVPMAIDQDPYFRMARDFVTTGPGRGLLKPAAIHSEFLVGLGGIGDKMSSSVVNAASTSIFLTDTEKMIKDKINKSAFSGGGKTLEEHIAVGGRLEIDVPYQYLMYFLEDDDELRRVATEYGTGRMKTSEIKALMIKAVTDFVVAHQRNRAAVTPEVLDFYFSKTSAVPDKPRFNHARTPREPITLLTDEQYAGFGVGFDRYFGQAKPHLMAADAAAAEAAAAAAEAAAASPAKHSDPAEAPAATAAAA